MDLKVVSLSQYRCAHFGLGALLRIHLSYHSCESMLFIFKTLFKLLLVIHRFSSGTKYDSYLFPENNILIIIGYVYFNGTGSKLLLFPESFICNL